MAKIVKAPDGTDIVNFDPWLEPYKEGLRFRYRYFRGKEDAIISAAKSLNDFADGYKYFGVNFEPDDKGWWYREWAPGANALFLMGDFNDWDKFSHPLRRDEFGVWEIFLPYEQYKDKFVHQSKFKVRVIGGGHDRERIPAYVKRVVQDAQNKDFCAQLWEPKKEFMWTDKNFRPEGLFPYKIYESHVGMAQDKEAVGTYKEFTANILPRIKEGGYNVVQLMAVQEHPYYGSFGYHVSNYFAPSSRFGTPDDLKELINTAHEMGLCVIMDLVHSHACKNVFEGLNDFDGTDFQYFHAPPRGDHHLWDSKLFDYGKLEVQRFLLSNLKYWLTEFHFDGFRFDGVTSMMYLHHGMSVAFDHYDRYFHDIDIDAIAYLQLANKLIHEVKLGAISIAEDVSGMPGLCRPVLEGGIGFDYRLAMGVPDFWIKVLKHRADEDWDVNELWRVLQDRRYAEKHVTYSESHDQALVGDKTIAFWLMCKEMYWHMLADDNNIVVERGVALHKMIRLITLALGAEAYLNFMGNEFGHPEWVDFPRDGNNWSYKYARRQWSLVDHHGLKYKYLWNFDKAMLALADKYSVMTSMPARQINMDNQNKVMVFERANLIFIFNFNTSYSIPNYRFGVPAAGEYRIVLSSDDKKFGGLERAETGYVFKSENIESHMQPNSIQVYTPNRTVMVLELVG